MSLTCVVATNVFFKVAGEAVRRVLSLASFVIVARKLGRLSAPEATRGLASSKKHSMAYWSANGEPIALGRVGDYIDCAEPIKLSCVLESSYQTIRT